VSENFSNIYDLIFLITEHFLKVFRSWDSDVIVGLNFVHDWGSEVTDITDRLVGSR